MAILLKNNDTTFPHKKYSSPQNLTWWSKTNIITPVLAVSSHFRVRFFVKIRPVCKDTDCKDTAKTGVIELLMLLIG